MPHRPFRLPLSAAAAAIGAVVLTSVGAAADDSPDGFDASTIKASSHRFGDAKPHPGARTVPLWTGHTTNPDDGVTYTYSIVGAAPASAGITPTSHGATYAVIDEAWFQPQAEALNTTLSYLHPYRLALFVTKNVVLFADHNPAHCCVLGAHGAVDTTRNNGNGRQSIQTFAWSSWLTAGFFNPAMHWAGQDINALSHEVTEWAVDPFGTNATQPWFSPIAPQYGCSALLETGDPTLNVGFSVGVKAFDQNPFTDGTYHPQDEAFLPWFMHTAPNTVSEPAQSSSGGRYTFLGDLNPFPFFHGPAPTC